MRARWEGSSPVRSGVRLFEVLGGVGLRGRAVCDFRHWASLLLSGIACLAVLTLVIRSASARAAPLVLQADPFTQQGEALTGGEAGREDQFGWSVALSADGETALIGAPSEDGGLGGAWVYTRSGSSWTRSARLLPAGETNAAELGWMGRAGRSSEFGRFVALSAGGETAMVGSRGGPAWVFVRSGSGWTQQTMLVGNEQMSAMDEYCGSVALSGDGETAMLGAYVGSAGAVGSSAALARVGRSRAKGCVSSKGAASASTSPSQTTAIRRCSAGPTTTARLTRRGSSPARARPGLGRGRCLLLRKARGN